MELDKYKDIVLVMKGIYSLATTVDDNMLAKTMMEADIFELSPQISPLNWKSALDALNAEGVTKAANDVTMALMYYTYSRYITISEQVSTRMGVKQQNWGSSYSVSEVNKYIVYEDEKAKGDILMRSVVAELQRLNLLRCDFNRPKRVQLIK